MEELSPQTLGSLKDKIKETIKECSGISNDKIMLFHNKARITGDDDTSLDDEKFKITNDSIIFVVKVHQGPAVEEKKAVPEKPHAPQQASPFGMGQQGMDPSSMYGMGQQGMDPSSMYGMGQQGMYGMPDQYGLDKQMLDQIVNNPDAVLKMMEAQAPQMSNEQKEFMKQNLEVIKKNPDLVKKMLSNPAMMNTMRNNTMMNNPMMNNPMMGSPMMNNPMMGSPMMNNPMMNNPMMGNYGYNPYMAPYMQTPPAPQDDQQPCSHGYYKPKFVNGRPEPQNAEELFADKLVSLNEMGFSNKSANIQALLEAKGDISEAIEILSKKHFQS